MKSGNPLIDWNSLSVGEELHDFDVIAKGNFPEMNIDGIVFCHKKTGAKLCALLNDDPNMAFAITFRTPPVDSKGTAHVLEHSVLCGSEKYPLREPFAVLNRASLKTFLNAATATSYTYYPVASQNEEDFSNLISVYLDAVLHPLLRPETFKREAWHYELSEENELSIKGVVYNEMKGRSSSVDSVLYKALMKALLPDTYFRFNSGGEPEDICRMSYEEFLNFHKTYYHPSNAFVFLYGKLDLDKRLADLNEAFGSFSAHSIDFESPIQSRIAERQELRLPYASDTDESGNIVLYSGLVERFKSFEESLESYLLSRLLYNDDSSRLKKALLDSGLGKKCAGWGFFDQATYGIFSFGLKGVKAEKEDAVLEICDKVFTELKVKPFAKEEIEACFNSLEFELREAVANTANRGIHLLGSLLDPWIFQNKPFYELDLFEALKDLRKKIESCPLYIESLGERLVKEALVKSKIVLEGTSNYTKEIEIAEKKYCTEVLSALREEEKSVIRQDQDFLKAELDKAEDEELIKKVPVLSLSKLETKPIHVEYKRESFKGSTLVSVPLRSAGISYLQLGVNVRGLAESAYSELDFLSKILFQCGSRNRNYVQFFQDVKTYTGGIHAELLMMPALSCEDVYSFIVEASTLGRNFPKALDLISEQLETLFSDKERVLQFTKKYKAVLNEQLRSSPYSFAIIETLASLRKINYLSSLRKGISVFAYVEALQNKIENSYEEFAQSMIFRLEELKNRGFDFVNLGVEDSEESIQKQHLEKFLGEAKNENSSSSKDVFSPTYKNLFLNVPLQVSAAVTAIDLKIEGHTPSGAFRVVSNYLDDTFLWDRIRMQGGAYGASSAYNDISSLFYFGSLSDPNPANTLGLLEELIKHLKEADISRDEIERNIIGVIGEHDRPMSPYSRALRARDWVLCGVDDSYRQTVRNEILNTSIEDFRRFGELLEKCVHKRSTCVIGPENKIQELQNMCGAVEIRAL